MSVVHASELTGRDWSRLIELFSDGCALCTCCGGRRVVHTNAALRRLLAEDPARTRLQSELDDVRGRLCTSGNGKGSDASVRSSLARSVRTAHATYEVRGTVLRVHSPSSAASLVVLILERFEASPLSDDVLCGIHRLTVREAQVARLLAAGKTNAEIAIEMLIRPKTAHHYTERVLLKLGVHHRAAVAAKLLQINETTARPMPLRAARFVRAPVMRPERS
jgi:DNA-binding CsgD family transcriptional regulator